MKIFNMSKENRNIYLQKSEIDKFVKTQVLNYNLAMKKISILVVFLVFISLQNAGYTQGPPVPMGPAKLPQQEIKQVEKSTIQQPINQENKTVEPKQIVNTEKINEPVPPRKQEDIPSNKQKTFNIIKKINNDKQKPSKTNKNEKNIENSIKKEKSKNFKILKPQPKTEDKEKNNKNAIQQNNNPNEKKNKEPQITNQENKETIVPSQINEYRQQAKFLYNSNNLDASLELFNKIPDEEKISDDWLFVANIAQDKEKPIDAVFYLKKSIALDDNNYKAHYNLGNFYLADNKVNMALNEYKKVLKLKKDYAYAYYNKGCCYLKKKSWFNARYEFGLAIKANPNEPAFYYNLAYTYKMMKKPKKAKEALEMYNKLMTQ